MTDTPGFRGTPPSQKQLSQALGASLPLWKSVVDMVKECGASWRWAHSEMTGAWSYRAYLPGDRFFVALSTTKGGFEASLNLKADEWDTVFAEGAEERALMDALRAKAEAGGEDPAWLHVPIATQTDLKVLAKLLVARGRRVQPARQKKKRR